MLLSERLFNAIDYIEFNNHRGNAVKACRTVERLVSEGQKYRLFQKHFPIQWKTSRSSFVKTGIYENYSERANEFFELVDQNLFPLLLGWNEDPQTDFDHFGIYSLNIDFCCAEIEYEYLNLSYVFGLLFLTGDEEIWEYLKEHRKICNNDFPPINKYAHENLWTQEKVSKTELYINLLEVIDHTTGNPWLDVSNCCQYSDTFDWSDKNIKFLSETFKQAEEIFDQMNLLDILIEANPEAILLDLITLWNEGSLTGKKAAGKTIERS